MTPPQPAAAPLGRADDPRPGVLVVEEDVAASDAASDLVRRLGFRVTAVSGMPDALAELRERQFALILLETQMAGMGAVEGLRLLRVQGGGRGRFATAGNTPAIALTPPDQAMDGERLRKLGFDDHLARPLRASQVRTVLNKHLTPPAGLAFNTAALGDTASGDAGTDTPVAAGASGASGAAGAAGASGAPIVAIAPADLLDHEALARLTELDPTGQGRLIQRVLQAFQSSSARLRAQAEAARLEDDHKALRLMAHTLKSSSASIGAMKLSRICAGIETSIRIESGEDLGKPLDAMNESLDAVLLTIAGMLKDAP